jgi:O-antigen/teichoic acid export membrane protein
LADENLDSKSYARRLVRGSAIVFAAAIISGVVTFLLRIFLARSLGVVEYGLFYAIFALVSFFALFSDLGLNSALAKYIPEFSVRKEFGAIKSSIAFAAVFQAVFAFSIAAMLFIFSGQIAMAVFETGDAVLPLQIMSAWFFVMTLYQITRNAFQGFQDMPAYALMDLFWTISVLFAAFLLVGVFGQGVGGAASAYLVATLVVAASASIFLWRQYPRVFKEKVSITKPLVKRLFAFALPALFGGIGWLVTGYTNTLMITVFRTLPEVGYYQAALPTASTLVTFGVALTAVFFPMVSELWARRGRVILSRALHFLIKFSFMLILPAALIFIAFPGIIIRLLFGEGYMAGVTALKILAGTAVVYTLYAILSSAIIGMGKPLLDAKITGAIAGLNLVGDLLLIPPYGIEGAAVATLCSFLLGLVLVSYYTRKLIRFAAPVPSLLKTLAGGVFTFLLIFDLKSTLVMPPWPKVFAVMIPSLIFYGVWILATKAVTRDDLKLIARIVPMSRRLVRAAGRLI